jgi:hypothetical protein
VDVQIDEILPETVRTNGDPERFSGGLKIGYRIPVVGRNMILSVEDLDERVGVGRILPEKNARDDRQHLPAPGADQFIEPALEEASVYGRAVKGLGPPNR